MIDSNPVVSLITENIIPVGTVGISVLLIYSVINSFKYFKNLIFPSIEKSPIESTISDNDYLEMQSFYRSEREQSQSEFQAMFSDRNLDGLEESRDFEREEMLAHMQEQRELEEEQKAKDHG